MHPTGSNPPKGGMPPGAFVRIPGQQVGQLTGMPTVVVTYTPTVTYVIPPPQWEMPPLGCGINMPTLRPRYDPVATRVYPQCPPPKLAAGGLPQEQTQLPPTMSKGGGTAPCSKTPPPVKICPCPPEKPSQGTHYPPPAGSDKENQTPTYQGEEGHHHHHQQDHENSEGQPPNWETDEDAPTPHEWKLLSTQQKAFGPVTPMMQSRPKPIGIFNRPNKFCPSAVLQKMTVTEMDQGSNRGRKPAWAAPAPPPIPPIPQAARPLPPPPRLINIEDTQVTQPSECEPDEKGDENETNEQEAQRLPKQKTVWNPRWPLPNENQPLPELLLSALREKALTAKQKQTVEDNLHRLPPEYQAALMASEFLPLLPYSIFHINLGNGAYEEHNQMVGRLLYQRHKPLLQEMIKQDLCHLKARKESVTARQARTFFFLKYGVANKTMLDIVGFPTMHEALGRSMEIGPEGDPDPRARPPPSGKGGKKRKRGNAKRLHQEDEENQTSNVQSAGQNNPHGNPPMQISTNSTNMRAPQRDESEQRLATKCRRVSPQPTSEQPLVLPLQTTAVNPANSTKPKRCSLEQLAQDAPQSTSERAPARKCVSDAANWETIDGTYQYRSHVIDRMEPQMSEDAMEVDEETDPPQSLPVASIAAEPVMREPSQHSDHSVMPIGTLQAERDSMEMPTRHLCIPAQKNNLTPAERVVLEQKRGQHGYTQCSEYTNPKAGFIYRCCLCNSPINTNGLERAIKSHMKKLHGSICEALSIRVIRPDWRELQVDIPGRPLPPRFKAKSKIFPETGSAILLKNHPLQAATSRGGEETERYPQEPEGTVLEFEEDTPSVPVPPVAPWIQTDIRSFFRKKPNALTQPRPEPVRETYPGQQLEADIQCGKVVETPATTNTGGEDGNRDHHTAILESAQHGMDDSGDDGDLDFESDEDEPEEIHATGTQISKRGLSFLRSCNEGAVDRLTNWRIPHRTEG